MQAGFNYFDTAHRYHGEVSEVAIRECLTSRYPREHYELTNKLTTFHGYIRKEEDQLQFFKNQLAICGVDYFDNYLIHALNMANYREANQYHSFAFIQKMKEEGYCKRTGFSFHGTPDLLDEILTAHPEVDMVQLQINYLDWLDAGIQAKKCYEIARKHDKLVVVMETIKGGNLIHLPEKAKQLMNEMHPDWSYAYCAIAFCASQTRIVSCPVCPPLRRCARIRRRCSILEH